MKKYTRYGNRKIYCSGEKRYTNAKELIDLVKLGEGFVVIDHKTKLDITSKVLMNNVACGEYPLERVLEFIRGSQ